MSKSAQVSIAEFLQEPEFVFIGLSRDPKHFSRSLFKEFLKHGYEPVPVNPNSDEIEGKTCYADVRDIPSVPGNALILRPEGTMKEAAALCKEAGVSRVWFYGVTGEKQVDKDAVQFCQSQSMEMIPGYCPFMFLPNAGFGHKIHTAVWKLLGKYPN